MTVVYDKNWTTNYKIVTDDVDRAIDIKNKILANSIDKENSVTIEIEIIANHGEEPLSIDE